MSFRCRMKKTTLEVGRAKRGSIPVPRNRARLWTSWRETRSFKRAKLGSASSVNREGPAGTCDRPPLIFGAAYGREETACAQTAGSFLAFSVFPGLFYLSRPTGAPVLLVTDLQRLVGETSVTCVAGGDSGCWSQPH